MNRAKIRWLAGAGLFLTIAICAFAFMFGSSWHDDRRSFRLKAARPAGAASQVFDNLPAPAPVDSPRPLPR